jgi:hypothetical protein
MSAGDPVSRLFDELLRRLNNGEKVTREEMRERLTKILKESASPSRPALRLVWSRD